MNPMKNPMMNATRGAMKPIATAARSFAHARRVPLPLSALPGTIVAAIAVSCLFASAAFAQAPPAPVAPPSTPSGAVTPPATGTPPAAPPGTPLVGVGSWGGRIGAAEVTIVGGNIASARERALAEALKQAVDQALASLVPEARANQPKVVVQVLGRARTYVRRYRTLEEGERERKIYAVRIEAEIDEVALQRAFEKGTPVAATGAAPPNGAMMPSYLLVAVGVADAGAAAGRAFRAAGARVQLAAADLVDPTKAVDAAAAAGLTNVAFVSGSATPDGKVRGPGLEAVSCALQLRVLTAGTGQPVANESESFRSFGDRLEATRADCFERAAAAAVPRVVPAAAGRAAPDMRTIVLDADITEPGAVPALVRTLRGIGSVSAIEVRRINVGRVELWVRSRLSATALATALGRDTGAVAVSGAEVNGDLVRLRARLRENAPAPAPPGVLTPSGSTGAGPVPIVKSPSP